MNSLGAHTHCVYVLCLQEGLVEITGMSSTIVKPNDCPDLSSNIILSYKYFSLEKQLILGLEQEMCKISLDYLTVSEREEVLRTKTTMTQPCEGNIGPTARTCRG